LLLIGCRHEPWEQSTCSKGANELRRNEPGHIGWANAREHPTPLLNHGEELRKQGKTLMLVALDGKAVRIVDPIDESTPDAIREPGTARLNVILVTGDNATTAKALADKLGSSSEPTCRLKPRRRWSKSISERVLSLRWLAME
jgi:cation transport ATPase